RGVDRGLQQRAAARQPRRAAAPNIHAEANGVVGVQLSIVSLGKPTAAASGRARVHHAIICRESSARPNSSATRTFLHPYRNRSETHGRTGNRGKESLASPVLRCNWSDLCTTSLRRHTAAYRLTGYPNWLCTDLEE